MSQQSNPIEFIPLNKLSASKLNVRKANRKEDIEALAASIAAHGLLQNLSVIAANQNRFEVVAGARRLAALKSLAASGAIAKDFVVPCQVLEPEDAGEASLAENVQRVAMDAMDEVEAFGALMEAGSTMDDIARRFGCGARHVEQRLALAQLSPKLKSAYRRGDLSLDAARAFCIVDDHAKQEAVFKALGKHVTHAPSVRSHLMQGAMRANDKIARFVGLDAYEAAGGHVRRDLFWENEAYIEDPALMTRLAEDRFESMREDLLAKGWGWVNINLGFARHEGGERIYPTRRSMTDAERAELQDLDAQLAKLDEDLEDSEEEDTRWTAYNDLSARRDALIATTEEWDPILKSLAGVCISLGHDGAPSFNFGCVAKTDAAKIRRIRNDRESAQARPQDMTNTAENDSASPPWEKAVSDLPKSLTREVTAARCRILRWKISESPDLALAVIAFTLHQRMVRGAVSGVALDLDYNEYEDDKSLANARADMLESIPSSFEASLEWHLGQTRETLLHALSIWLTGALDLQHDGVSREDGRRQTLADALAATLDLDMREYWRPDEAYWARLPKAVIIDALLHIAGGDADKAAHQKAHAKLSKDELVKLAARSLPTSGYLPDVLVTPKPQGAYALTGDGYAAIAAE